MLTWGVSILRIHITLEVTCLCSFLYCYLESLKKISRLFLGSCFKSKGYFFKFYWEVYFCLHVCLYTWWTQRLQPKRSNRYTGRCSRRMQIPWAVSENWTWKLQQQQMSLTVEPRLLPFNCFLICYFADINRWSVRQNSWRTKDSFLECLDECQLRKDNHTEMGWQRHIGSKRFFFWLWKISQYLCAWGLTKLNTTQSEIGYRKILVTPWRN